MGRNIWALGDRSITGTFGRVMSAGDINIEDATIRSLYAAGDVNITNSSVEKVRAAGDFHATSCAFHNISVAGDLTMNGACSADTVVICGEINAEYLKARVLRNFFKPSREKNIQIDGKRLKEFNHAINNMEGSYKVETFENLLWCKIDFDYTFTNVINLFRLSGETLECEQLFSFGGVEFEEINAEYAFFSANTGSKVESIVGATIVIAPKLQDNRRFASIPLSMKTSEYQIDLTALRSEPMVVGQIEADTIQVEAAKIGCISGRDVVIGDFCTVDRVEYQNSITVSEKAVVSEIVKL